MPFLYGLILALLIPWPLLAWTEIAPLRIFTLQLGAALLVVAACSWPPLRFALVPGPIRRAQAREAAQHEFVSRGMAETRGRTGVLLFVAAAERHAEVIGDAAIAGQVDEAEWRAIIEDLVAALGRGSAADGLVTAVAAIGVILARTAPRLYGDRDELPNRVVLL
jgi:putative membrane protein